MLLPFAPPAVLRWDYSPCLNLCSHNCLFRIAQVDASQPENQSPGILNGSLLRINIESVCTICIYNNTSWPGFLCKGAIARKRSQGNGVFGIRELQCSNFFIYSENVLLTLVWYRITCCPPWSGAVGLRDTAKRGDRMSSTRHYRLNRYEVGST